MQRDLPFGQAEGKEKAVPGSQATAAQHTASQSVSSLAQKNSPILYGLGSFGLESAYKVFWGFYLFYYVDVLGLAVTLAAMINVVYGIWDALNDPLFGYLSDNTRTRWGRRRPWLLAGLPFYVGFLVLTYAVPGPLREGLPLFWYALAMVMLFETASTVMSVNYDALFPELFQGVRVRARASSIYQGFCMSGELVGFALTPIVYAQFGFVGMALLFAAVTGVTLTIGVVGSSEDPRVQEQTPLGIRAAFQDVLRDRPYWLFVTALTFLTFTTSVYTLATPFWCKYTLGAGPRAPSVVFATVFVVAIASVSLWSRWVRAMGIKRTWLCAVAVMLSSALALGLAPNLLVGLIGAALVGVGLGGIKVCREMIVANLVDQSLARTGHRREGAYYSLLRVFGKLSKVLEAGALALLGLLFGYVSGEDPGPEPGTAFRFLIGVLPAVFVTLALLLSRRLPFQGRQAESEP
jgi:GPH family glycoside/pentoside/hexuronide:cation symporter